MFSYTISKEADRSVFEQTCELLENAVTDLQKEALLEDVDGSMIQYYSSGSAEIKVFNDYEIDDFRFCGRSSRGVVILCLSQSG